MKTVVDISRMGNVLNMRSVFSMYVKELFATPGSNAQARMNELRKSLLHTIHHFSYAEVNSLMADLVRRTSNYQVLTRNDLEKALTNATPFHLLATSAMMEDEGQHEAMLYLLYPAKDIYKRKTLLARYGFINNAAKTESHE